MKEKYESIESGKNNSENKNAQVKYQLQEFNKSEEENFKILNQMLEKMKNLNGKYFFKQLGQFLGGLYNIALNREKLTGLKGFREKFKSSTKGVKAVKTYIDNFLKAYDGNDILFNALHSLLEFVGKEIGRSNSALRKIKGYTGKNSVYQKIPNAFGYDSYIIRLKMNTLNDGIVLGKVFSYGWNPFPNEQELNNLGLSEEEYPVSKYQQNCLEMTKVVKKSLLESIRNPNLKFYVPGSIDDEKLKTEKDKKQKIERTIYPFAVEMKNVCRTFETLEKLVKTDNPNAVFKKFGEGLGALYFVCEKSRGWKSIFSSSEKGASGAVGKIKEFLKATGGTLECAEKLDDLMEFLLGPKGVNLSSSRLYCLENDLLGAWRKVKEAVVVKVAKLKEFKKENKASITTNDELLNDDNDELCYTEYKADYWSGKNIKFDKELHKMDYKFHNENFLPAKMKMAKIVQKECLSIYNEIKIESK